MGLEARLPLDHNLDESWRKLEPEDSGDEQQAELRGAMAENQMVTLDVEREREKTGRMW